jgi:hypothetical protein
MAFMAVTTSEAWWPVTPRSSCFFKAPVEINTRTLTLLNQHRVFGNTGNVHPFSRIAQQCLEIARP